MKQTIILTKVSSVNSWFLVAFSIARFRLAGPSKAGLPLVLREDVVAVVARAGSCVIREASWFFPFCMATGRITAGERTAATDELLVEASD